MRIGIVANQGKPEAALLADKLIEYIRSKNIETVYCRKIYEDNGQAKLLDDVDYIYVLGGDGTILGLLRMLGNKSVPILGLNFGTLGFIAESDPKDYKSVTDKLIRGDFYISERILLKGSVYKENEKEPHIYYSMNEFVVSKSENVRLLSVNTYVNNDFLVSYKADGLIVACATGSTAYNLSAGGPVMHPGVKAYIITPICPHTLCERPLIVPESEVFTIKPNEGQKALFSIDGQCNETISEKDYVKIEVSDKLCRLVQFDREGFYDKLKSRLFWGK